MSRGCTCDTPSGSESRNCSYCRGFDDTSASKPKKQKKVRVKKNAETVLCTLQVIALKNGGMAIKLVE